MIKNGRPYTNENGYIDDALISSHNKEEIAIILDWINTNFIPRKTVLRTSSSYGLKHILQHDTGIYLTNNEFKDAMLMAGYGPTNPNELNWHYCISKRSPVFAPRTSANRNSFSAGGISNNSGIVGNIVNSTISNNEFSGKLNK